MTKILRDYQQEAIDATFNGLQDGINKQMIVMATGLGKTFVATNIANQFIRILFICHREELILQAVHAFEEIYPMQVGIVKEKTFEIDKKIVVGSVQTLANRLQLIKNDEFDLVIIDEIHHYLAVTWVKVAHYFKPQLLLGLTATPHRLDGLNLSNIVDKITFDYGIEPGVRNGYLCQPEAFRIRTGTDISKIKRTGGDFAKKELSVVVDSPGRNSLVVQKYQQYADGRPGIVFAVDIAHAQNLLSEFRKVGISSDLVVSDEDITPERSETIKKFKAGQIQVIVNVMILTEGFDYPDVGCIMMARPTESLTVYIQAIGRGLRLKSDEFKQRFGADNCIILDFVDNSGKHKLINTWTLEQDLPIKDKVFMGEKRKEEWMIKIATERKIKIEQGKDKKVNLLQLPKIKLKTDRGGFLDPASDKQIAWLKSEGVWQENVEYTKGQATEYITNFEAKDWQIAKLRSLGYDISKGVTQGQYYEIIREENNKRMETKTTPQPKKPFESFRN